MAAQRKYPDELRGRATRLVLEARAAGDCDRTAGIDLPTGGISLGAMAMASRR